jgi:transglutaminase-like putative cysteine protease
MVVDQKAAEWPLFKIAPHAHSFPFNYSKDERSALGALLVPEYPDPQRQVASWARSIVAGEGTDTLSLLQDLSNASRDGILYAERELEGTQAPGETLSCSSGSCRDLATLFIEAARHLGLGARAVSGYLFDPPRPGCAEVPQHGSTHAWAEVYLPCAGWIAFDPTNGRMGEANLIPVASARNITQIKPVEGSFLGAEDAYLGMEVQVAVSGHAQKTSG